MRWEGSLVEAFPLHKRKEISNVVHSNYRSPRAISNWLLAISQQRDEGFKGISKKPIKPAVKNKGNKLGMIETNIILNERNIKAIKSAVSKNAKAKEESKLSSR